MLGRNLCLIGPPGSGKGSYGRHLAKALGIPLVTSSDVLRKSRKGFDLASGRLVDDGEVSSSLLESLQECPDGYILDGFPRTVQQVQMMEDTWPAEFRLHGGVKLAVPDQVCMVKLKGRRSCNKCGGNFNVNEVDFDNWYLPSSLPVNCPRKDCNPGIDWVSRPDDNPAVVEERLALYHKHMDPILDYFSTRNRLLRLHPYKGYDDVPMMISLVQDWLVGMGNQEC